eukprot:snap_masked-scaffold_13-processed-gene-11.28-mRNA-1 protein AED:1.00 eAED:1.00 QI:0/0/0/0/1/1/2/0/80
MTNFVRIPTSAIILFIVYPAIAFQIVRHLQKLKQPLDSLLAKVRLTSRQHELDLMSDERRSTSRCGKNCIECSRYSENDE